MVAVKAHQAAAFLKSIDPKVVAVLLYGTDPGMVSERATAAARALAERDNPAGEILRIEDADLDAEPDRINLELQTVAMFGGRKVVRTSASRRVNAKFLEPLLAPGAMTGALVVEAGNLRADEALRVLFEKPAHAVAIACYGDEARDIENVVREILTSAELDITTEARQLLVSRLGADRALTRAELDKLVLYAHGKERIEIEDVEAVVGDASEQVLDTILFAASGGAGRRAVVEFDRAVASGESPQMIVSATQRHFQRLHRLRSALDAGRSFEDAARGLRPPLHFKSKPVIEAHCRAWDAARLDRAIAAIARSAKDARLSVHLESTIAERLLLELATMAGSRR